MLAIYSILAGVAGGLTAWISASHLAERPLSGWYLRLWILFAAGLCGLCGCAARVYVIYFPGFLRLLASLSALTGAAVCDLREKRIPNFFPAALFCVYVALSTADWLLIPENGASSFVGGLIGGGVMFLLLLLFRGLSMLLFHQQGIGLGDLKLMTALGLVLGLGGAVSTLLTGQIAALVSAILLLISRKAKLKDTLPLAPFLFAGLAADILLGIL